MFITDANNNAGCILSVAATNGTEIASHKDKAYISSGCSVDNDCDNCCANLCNGHKATQITCWPQSGKCLCGCDSGR